mgnify:FL=1
MIIETIFNIIFSVVDILLTPFDGLNLIISSNVFNTVLEYLSVVTYVLPIQNFIPIFVFIISTMLLRIVISALKTLWDILPLV